MAEEKEGTEVVVEPTETKVEPVAPVEPTPVQAPKVEKRNVDLSGLTRQIKAAEAAVVSAEKGKTKAEEDGIRSRDRMREMQALAISQVAMRELDKQGADPALADLAVSGLDLTGVEVTEGRIEGVTEAVAKLLDKRPELMLKTKATVPGTLDGAPGGSKIEASDPLTYDREQLADMTDEEWDAFADTNPQVIMQLGDGPPITFNISSMPNVAFARVKAAQKRHAEVTARLTGG